MTVVAVGMTLLGGLLVVRFRRIAGWFDRVLRTLADGPEADEPADRGGLGRLVMVGTGKSVSARWYRATAVLLVGLTFLVVGAGALLGAWDL